MMGSAMKYRPVGPPPGVDPARWHAHIEEMAHEQYAFEQRMRYVREQDARLGRRDARRRRRQFWVALIGLAVLLATVGVQWTLGAVAVIVWWKAGHPGLERAQQSARTHLSRRTP